MYTTPKKSKGASKNKRSPTPASTPSSTSTTSTKRSTPSKSPTGSTVKRLKSIELHDSSEDESAANVINNTSINNTSSKKKKKKTNKEKMEKKKKKEKKKKEHHNKKNAKTPSALPVLVYMDFTKLTTDDLRSLVVIHGGFTKEQVTQMEHYPRYEVVFELLDLYDLFEIRAFVTSLHAQLGTEEEEMRQAMKMTNKWQKKRSAQEAVKLLERFEEIYPVHPG